MAWKQNRTCVTVTFCGCVCPMPPALAPRSLIHEFRLQNTTTSGEIQPKEPFFSPDDPNSTLLTFRTKTLVVVSSCALDQNMNSQALTVRYP